jgi:hypothetical protein
MDFNIHNYENINIEYQDGKKNSKIKTNLLFGKKFKYGSNNKTIEYINLYFNSSSKSSNICKEKIIIQTPILFMPQSVFKMYGKEYVPFAFLNEENDKKCREFKNWINKLEDDIFKHIKKFEINNVKLKKKDLNRLIKYDNFLDSDKFLISINKYTKCIQTKNGISKEKDSVVFDWNINAPTYATAVLWIRNIWVKNNKWGLNVFCYLIRAMPSHIIPPIDIIMDDADPRDIENKMLPIEIPTYLNYQELFYKNNHIDAIHQENIIPEEYQKYFKMIKMGIPKEAVVQKIQLAGLDPSILNNKNNLNSINNLNGLYPPPPPPLPSNSIFDINTLPPPPNYILNDINKNNSIQSNNKTTTVNNALMNQISSGNFKLKKITDKDRQSNKSDLDKVKKKDIRVPSLDEILLKLKSLRRTKSKESVV